jgi:hypothetical protein
MAFCATVRWRISLVLPAVNLDPMPPDYPITVHYRGDQHHNQARAKRRANAPSFRSPASDHLL